MGRNTLQSDANATLDLRASREVKRGTGKEAPALTLSLDAFNLLNRVNYAGYVGTVGLPRFALPVSARLPRQLQGAMRFTF